MYQDLNLFQKFLYVGQLKYMCPFTNVQGQNKNPEIKITGTYFKKQLISIEANISVAAEIFI